MQLERGIFRVFRYRTQTLTLADFNRKGIYLKDIGEERKIVGFASVHATYTKIDHIQGHNVHNKFKS